MNLIPVLALMLFSGPVVPREPSVTSRRCITSCAHGQEYGQDVLHCWYDDLPRCARFQPECRDEGLVVCLPRVVNLGPWDPRPGPNDPMVTYTLTEPPGSSLPPMGP